MTHSLINKEDSGHVHEEHPDMLTHGLVVLTGEPDGWYTIAEGNARCFGKFTVFDSTNGGHNIIEFTAAWSYGTAQIDTHIAVRYSRVLMNMVRILRSTDDPTYAPAKLQVYLAPSATTADFKFECIMMMAHTFPWWDHWYLNPVPVLEGTPTGYQQSPLAYSSSDCVITRSISNSLKVNGTATATAHVVNSDRRIKENIEIITEALAKIKEITGVTYNRNDIADKETRYSGIIAQDLQKILPEAVVVNSEGMLHVDYDAVVPLLLESLKELYAKIKTVRAEVNRRKQLA